MKKFLGEKKLDIALLIGIVAAIFISNFTVFAEDCNDLRDSVVRLHILANSDSVDDQTLKLAVRDEVLLKGGAYFSDELSLEEAEENIAENLDFFKSTAEAVVARYGYCYEVKCELAEMYFERREYENFSLPAGNYMALRITIGAAAGKNWWCVMYPPLCLPAATDVSEYTGSFTPTEIDMMKNPQKFKVKFKILEIIEKLRR